MSFGLSALLIAVAAVSPGGVIIGLEPAHRFMVGLIIGGYCALQLLARVRYSYQEVFENPPTLTNSNTSRVLVGEVLFIISLPAFATCLPIYKDESPTIHVWAVIVIVLGAVSIWSFWLASRRPTRAEVRAAIGRPGEDVRAAQGARRRNRLLMATATVAVTITALLAAYSGWYSIQLLSAMAVVLGIVTPSVLGPTISFIEQRKRHRTHHLEEPAPAKPVEVERTNTAQHASDDGSQ
jgi:hypothetical protein